MILDFFARERQYIDHLAPVYKALPSDRRGAFCIDKKLLDYARKELKGCSDIVIFDGNIPPGKDAILTAAYGDMMRAARDKTRKIISMEHGIGHAFGTAAYPNGPGKRDLVDLFLMPNEYVVRLSKSVRQTRCEVIGTPKMDEWLAGIDPMITIQQPEDPPTIAIAFHWGEVLASPPESGTAWDHYKAILPELAGRYHVIGHGHPISANIYRREFERWGIEWIENFRDVLLRADVYVNDLSSTMYEFLLTGKPVVVLNAPWFRRDVHWGIRFWDYSDVGINVEDPGDLFRAIDETLDDYGDICLAERRQAIKDLYPYPGCSARRAVEVLLDYMQ